MKVIRVPLSEITVRERKRSPGSVEELAQSIAELGLLNPITITPDYVLVAGYHRLEACKLLGWQEIEARVIEVDELHAELAEIDENLIRNELTALERAEHLRRRKEIYEALHPRAKHGGAPGRPGGGKLPAAKDETVSSFAEDTAARTGLSPRTIQQDVQIATNLAEDVKEAIRGTPLADEKRELLELARLPHEEQRAIVQKIVAGEAKKVKEAARLIDIERQREKILRGEVVRPEGVFEVVVMDPPWPYGREYDPDGSRVASPYPEMSIEELMALSPPFADDCVLFLWTTHQFIWDAKRLMDHWGFEYKAILVWDKEQMGVGRWFRMQCEFCLVGIRGKPVWNNTRWRDIIREPRREHSRKPESFYKMVEEITAGRRLDFFAREKREGWEVFGNDVERFKSL